MDVGLQCCGWGSKSHVETTCGAIDAMEGWRSSAMGAVLAKAAAVPTGSWFSGSHQDTRAAISLRFRISGWSPALSQAPESATVGEVGGQRGVPSSIIVAHMKGSVSHEKIQTQNVELKECVVN